MTLSARPLVQPFRDDSVIRRVQDEAVLLLGGGRALLMQVAHPSVAQGVVDHSGFRQQRWQRLLRTLKPMYAIVFGTPEQITAAVESINHRHSHVYGEGYTASDPALLLWVWAALVDTALYMHRRFVGALSEVELDAYYEDAGRLAILLGIPPESLPPTAGAFERYVTSQVESIVLSAHSRQIEAQLFRPWPPQWLVMLPLRQLTAGLMPQPLRVQYGMGWGTTREAALTFAAGICRRAISLLPRRLRGAPAWLMPSKS